MWSCGVLRLSFAYKKHCSSSAHFQACECCCGFGVGLSTLNRMDYQRAWTWICWNDWITLVRTKCITSCVIVLGVMRPSRCVLSKKWLSLSMTSDEEQHECVGMGLVGWVWGIRVGGRDWCGVGRGSTCRIQRKRSIPQVSNHVTQCHATWHWG